MAALLAAEAAPRRAGPFYTGIFFQVIAALSAVPVGLAVLHFAVGPKLLTLFACGAAFAITYLGTLRATGRLPPVRDWIPTRAAAAV